MDNKKLLKQVLKIDQKADLHHVHNEYVATEDLPSGGMVSIDIKASQWEANPDGLYSTVVRHQLNTVDLIIEAVSNIGDLLMVGYSAKGENIAVLYSEEAIDMSVTILHRAQAHTAIGYNPIADDVTNNFQTWSSEKIDRRITEVTGTVDMSGLATKDEVSAALASVAIDMNTKAEKTYVDNKLATKLDAVVSEDGGTNISVNNIEVTGAILPKGRSGTIDIGSPEQRFKGLYVDEAYLSTNTLYIGDTPILGTNQDTIMIKADPDQSITMRTSATGVTKVISESGVEFSTSGMNANVNIQATGQNSNVNMSSQSEVNITSPITKITGDATIGNAVITGNLTVNGDRSILKTNTVKIKDNLIDINSEESGMGVTNGGGHAGIQISRGDLGFYQIVFDEADDKVKIGAPNNLKAVALEENVAGLESKLKSYTDNAIGELMGSAPEALNTLQELATALGNDANFSTTIATQIGLKADKETTQAELDKKADKTFVTESLSAKANIDHDHIQFYTKDEINQLLASYVKFEPVSSAYSIKYEPAKDITVSQLMEELKAEREARQTLENKLAKIEKSLNIK